MSYVIQLKSKSNFQWTQWQAFVLLWCLLKELNVLFSNGGKCNNIPFEEKKTVMKLHSSSIKNGFFLLSSTTDFNDHSCDRENFVVTWTKLKKIFFNIWLKYTRIAQTIVGSNPTPVIDDIYTKRFLFSKRKLMPEPNNYSTWHPLQLVHNICDFFKIYLLSYGQKLYNS